MKKDVYPVCPICGEQCDTAYRDFWGNYVGCETCIELKDAWEEEECFWYEGNEKKNRLQ